MINAFIIIGGSYKNMSAFRLAAVPRVGDDITFMLRDVVTTRTVIKIGHVADSVCHNAHILVWVQHYEGD